MTTQAILAPPDTAVILAAGRGARLAPLTNEVPKCLLRLGRTTLIRLQMKHLRAAGISHFVIVTGYREEKVREACGSESLYIQNKAYATTNSLYSLWKARRHVQRGCLVLNSDVVFPREMLTLLLQSPHANALLVDFREDLGEEEMKMVVRDGRILRLSKNIAPWEAQGENVEVLKLGPEGGTLLMKIAAQTARAGQKKLWVPQGIDHIAGTQPFHAASAQGLPWTEIDYMHDYERARTVIYQLCR